jgi:hypothetical protein
MKRENRHLRHAVRGGTTRLKFRQQPVQPPAPSATHPDLRIESSQPLPSTLIEAGDDQLQEPLIGPIMWLVIVLSLVFIGFIAWLIRNSP